MREGTRDWLKPCYEWNDVSMSITKVVAFDEIEINEIGETREEQRGQEMYGLQGEDRIASDAKNV